MSPHTAKTIKELTDFLASMGGFYHLKRADYYDKLEKLLHEFAENIRTDTIEP